MPDLRATSTLDDVRRVLVEALGNAVDTLVEHTAEDPGSGGRSFIAEVAGRRLHVKLVGDDSMRTLPLGDELALLESISGLGIAPVPVATVEAEGLIVTELLSGFRSSRAEELRAPPAIEAVAALLGRLHRSGGRAPARSARSIAEDYIDRVVADRMSDPAAETLADELLGLAAWFLSWPESPVLCHGDLVASNILRTTGAVVAPEWRLVDFEYALHGPPVWDLASMSVMNEFTDEHDALLLRCYYAERGVPFPVGDFAKVRRLTALIAHFWSHAQGDSDSSVERYRLDASAGID